MIANLIPKAVVHQKMALSDREVLFKVKSEDIKLSELFGKLQTLKSVDKVIKDFSLTQSSLEQVFLLFARFQENLE